MAWQATWLSLCGTHEQSMLQGWKTFEACQHIIAKCTVLLPSLIIMVAL